METYKYGQSRLVLKFKKMSFCVLKYKGVSGYNVLNLLYCVTEKDGCLR